ncbi:hypothetical protein CNECB9_4760011 [Cupriavidus necator]|uniref:Uncharacterized protein n=1 Tax=Cupriavidus necator TaxID=106590 RepID=A0A1K0JU57_CUPNE|nr:hypothetical protein CNECB9_4760011 [Cupriavidus necator]
MGQNSRIDFGRPLANNHCPDPIFSTLLHNPLNHFRCHAFEIIVQINMGFFHNDKQWAMPAALG